MMKSDVPNDLPRFLKLMQSQTARTRTSFEHMNFLQAVQRFIHSRSCHILLGDNSPGPSRNRWPESCKTYLLKHRPPVLSAQFDLA